MTDKLWQWTLQLMPLPQCGRHLLECLSSHFSLVHNRVLIHRLGPWKTHWYYISLSPFGHSWSKWAKSSALRILPKAWSLEIWSQFIPTDKHPEEVYKLLLFPREILVLTLFCCFINFSWIPYDIPVFLKKTKPPAAFKPKPVLADLQPKEP